MNAVSPVAAETLPSIVHLVVLTDKGDYCVNIPITYLYVAHEGSTIEVKYRDGYKVQVPFAPREEVGGITVSEAVANRFNTPIGHGANMPEVRIDVRK